MPFHDYVDVRVTVNGTPVQEYLDPDGEEAGEKRIVRHIEATAGQCFEVTIRCLPGFQLEKASNLVHRLCLDGINWIPHQPIECKGLPAILNTEKSCYYRHANVNVGNGQFKEASLTFGALAISESAELQASFDTEKLKYMGEIKLTIYRGGEVVIGSEYVPQPPSVHDEIPEKLMKGRLLKSNVKNVYRLRSHPAFANRDHRYDITGVDGRPIARRWKCSPLEGQAGQESVFVFKYRSRKILQRLGCIPRSPSPQPDYALISERQEEFIRSAKEEKRRANLENLRLRQEIEDLKRYRSATVEQRGVKRERDDDDDLEEVAPPPKKPFAVIDLTEDD